jgi:glycosyltransferase involved in cell wall biosynthesis
LVWEKNVETLFSIYDEIEAQGIDVNFVIAGNGVAEEIARQRMKNAIFLGFLDHEDLAKVYASCDIFVFTSISETYGNVVVEAMASGCVPVIANGGGSQALVKDGITGFLCEPNDPVDYIDKIKVLLNDKEFKGKMQQTGYEYALPLSWDRLAKEYFQDIETLAHKSLPEKENEPL